MSWLDELVEGNYSPRNLEQGSEKWEQIRAGRFTSSEIWKIMEFGKRPMTPDELKARPKSGKGSATTQVPDPSKMSDRGMGYITQKVAEVLTGRPKQAAYAYPCTCTIQNGQTLHPCCNDFGRFGSWCIGRLQCYPCHDCDPIQFGWLD